MYPYDSKGSKSLPLALDLELLNHPRRQLIVLAGFAHFARLDCPASSKQTRETAGGGSQVQAGLIPDLEDSAPYF